MGAALASLILIISIANGLVIGNQVQPTKIIKVQSTLVLDDRQKVTAFVNELMTKRQASCLLWIFVKESQINPKSKNPKSTAKGVGQLLDSTYQTLGLKHSADPIAQVVAATAYISRHYGSDGACAAKRFWQKHYYY
jgi:hypothetical protein